MSVYIVKPCQKCRRDFLGHIAQRLCKPCSRTKKPKEPYKRICLYVNCKKPFETPRKNQVFCSKFCRKEYHSEIYYRRKNVT